MVKRARDAGVTGMLITGTNALESQQAQRLAEDQAGFCWSTAGVHPHHASEWSTEIASTLRRLAEKPEVVAIGECGLDFNRNLSAHEQQEYAFDAQLALAAELNMPVFLHCREAHARFAAVLAPWLPKLPGAVIHCFTGTRDELEACLGMGLSVGITGWVCDERRGLELRELLPLIPADRLLLETDAPYLLPRDMRPRPTSRRNEPCFYRILCIRWRHGVVRVLRNWRPASTIMRGRYSDWLKSCGTACCRRCALPACSAN